MGKPSRTNPLRLTLHVLRTMLVCLLAAEPLAAQVPATSVVLHVPCAMAYDTQGNLYFTERDANLVRRLAPDGTLTTVAGDGTQGFFGDGGPATSAELDSPCGVAVANSGDLYVADTHNHRIRRIVASTGTISTIAGTGSPGFSGDGGSAVSATLAAPTALVPNAAGDLLIADTRNHRIRRISATNGTISTVAGDGAQGFAGDGGPATSAELDSPSGLALDSSGNLYIADSRNDRIRKVTAATGIISTLAGDAAAPGLPSPQGDGGPATAATLALPRGVTVDTAGNLYIADTADQRIRRVDGATGVITTITGARQGFSGDLGLASAAALDSPRTVALSPSGLVTVADSENGRIRQLGSAAAPTIRTIAGLSSAGPPPSLVLTGPSTETYGSGSITATLSGETGATGQILLFDSSGANSSTQIGAAALSGSVVSLSTSSLPAGSHTLTATYPGDSTHAPAQSPPFVITVTPLPLTAVATSVTVLYGSAMPVLSGTLTGVLPGNLNSVQAAFTSPAVKLSPAGIYPISASLSGPAASNYTVGTITGSLTIAQAPTTATLLLTDPTSGALSIHALSSTSGTPTGSITLVDSGSTLTSLTLQSGSAAFSSSALTSGVHVLQAIYSGDRNFLPSASPLLAIGSSGAGTGGAGTSGSGPGDFALAASGNTAQSVPSGTPAVYNFSVTPQSGPLASPVTLAISGALPIGVTASFNPAYLPPSSSPISFTLTLQTTKSALVSPPVAPRGGFIFSAALLCCPLPVWFFGRRRKWKNFPWRRAIFASASCIVFATLTSACGDRVNVGTEAETAPTYTLTVTGTATSASGSPIQHSATITLQVL